MTTSHGKLLFLYKERLQSIARHQLERGRLGDEVTLIFDHFIRVVDRIFGGSFDSSANAETWNFTNLLVIEWRSTSVRIKSHFSKCLIFKNIFCVFAVFTTPLKTWSLWKMMMNTITNGTDTMGVGITWLNTHHQGTKNEVIMVKWMRSNVPKRPGNGTPV